MHLEILYSISVYLLLRIKGIASQQSHKEIDGARRDTEHPEHNSELERNSLWTERYRDRWTAVEQGSSTKGART